MVSLPPWGAVIHRGVGMRASHPSGRPRPSGKRGTSTYIRWPRDGFVNPRLGQPEQLSGGFGFRLPESELKHLHHVALAKRKGEPER